MTPDTTFWWVDIGMDRQPCPPPFIPGPVGDFEALSL
jgi:hypothetical protein